MTAVDASSTLTPPVSEHDHAQGPANAKVTLVEYGDYECSYCGQCVPDREASADEIGEAAAIRLSQFPAGPGASACAARGASPLRR